MTIGDVARQSGVPAKTIRYYESIGLIDPPRRADNGYRVYDARSVQLLQFIKRGRDLGFGIDEVTELLALWQDRDRHSSEVHALAARHLADIQQRIDELVAMRRAVEDLLHRCHGDDRPDCPILDDLATGGT